MANMANAYSDIPRLYHNFHWYCDKETKVQKWANSKMKGSIHQEFAEW